MKKHEWFQMMMISALVMHTYGFVTAMISYAAWALIAYKLGNDD